MIFDELQINKLRPYEDYFRKATTANWCPYPGRDAVKEIAEMWQSVYNGIVALNYSCQECILHLMQDVGTAYFQDLNELRIKELKAKMGEKKEAKNGEKFKLRGIRCQIQQRTAKDN